MTSGQVSVVSARARTSEGFLNERIYRFKKNDVRNKIEEDVRGDTTDTSPNVKGSCPRGSVGRSERATSGLNR